MARVLMLDEVLALTDDRAKGPSKKVVFESLGIDGESRWTKWCRLVRAPDDRDLTAGIIKDRGDLVLYGRTATYDTTWRIWDKYPTLEDLRLANMRRQKYGCSSCDAGD